MRLHQLPIQLTTTEEFFQYFEKMAVQHKKIMHEIESSGRERFFRDSDKMTGVTIGGMVLLVTLAGGSFLDDHGDNIHAVPRYEFFVLKSVGVDASQKEIDQAMDECQPVLRSILSKLYYDSDPLRGINRRFTQFDFNTITFNTVDTPKFSNGFVGHTALAPLGNPTDVAYYDPEEWQ